MQSDTHIYINIYIYITIYLLFSKVNKVRDISQPNHLITHFSVMLGHIWVLRRDAYRGRWPQRDAQREREHSGHGAQESTPPAGLQDNFVWFVRVLAHRQLCLCSLQREVVIL